jgi:hypothetical protein
LFVRTMLPSAAQHSCHFGRGHHQKSGDGGEGIT